MKLISILQKSKSKRQTIIWRYRNANRYSEVFLFFLNHLVKLRNRKWNCVFKYKKLMVSVEIPVALKFQLYKAGTLQSNCDCTGFLWKQVMQKHCQRKNQYWNELSINQWSWKLQKCYSIHFHQGVPVFSRWWTLS